MKKHFFIALIIMTTTLLLHCITVPEIFGFTVSLSMVGYMLAIRFLPSKYAVTVATITSGLIYFDVATRRFAIVILLHTVVISLLYKRGKKELFPWTFIAVLVSSLGYFLVTYFYYGFDSLSYLSYVTYLQRGLNFILIALILDLITVYLPYTPWLRKVISFKKPILFGQIIFNLIVVVAILPLLLITGLNLYIQYDETFDYYLERTASFEKLINGYVDELDETEVQRLLLGSTIERGYLNQSIDQFVTNTNDSVYFFNQNQSLFTSSSGAIDYHILDQTMQNGKIIEWDDQHSIWVDDNDKVEANVNFYNGHIIYRSSILDKDIHMIMPLSEHVLAFASKLFLYTVLIMLVFLASFVFGIIADLIFTKQLSQLNLLSSELPSAMLAQKELKVPESRVLEFSQLANNIGIVGERLKKMFYDLDEKTEQLRSSEQNLYRVAHQDNLTGMPNRRSFYRDLEKLINDKLDKFAILFIDFDHFKKINDSYGHSSGDQLLIEIANRFRQVNKRHEGLYFYRLAGDEFIAVIRERNHSEVEAFGQDLLNELANPFYVKGNKILISASVGISFYPMHGDTLDTLLHAADQAMYELKRQHRNGLNFAPKRGD